MDWQLILVLLIVAAAVVYLARSSWRTWRGRKTGCGGGCSCAKTSVAPAGAREGGTLIPLEQLSLRRRPAPPA
jgi:hypothetical protein